MPKLLVVDDETNIRLMIRKYAEFEGHTVTEAPDGMKALEIYKNTGFDLIILDIMMPELDGFSTCKEMKKVKDTPVIMLSARGEEYDKLHGFELGVDDYVVKPFSPKELMARVAAVLLRAGKTGKSDSGTMAIGGLSINFLARDVTIDGTRVDLSPKEYDLLFYMAKNSGIALTREKLITEVWGYDFYGDDRTLDTHIKLLRNSIGEYRSKITTLRGVGYRFETE